jgi:hypothetical protein
MATDCARDTDVARFREITIERASSSSSLSSLSCLGPARLREVKVDGHHKLAKLIISLVGRHKFIDLNGLVKINQITELLMNNVGCPFVVHMVDGMALNSDNDQVLTKEKLSIKKPCVNERPRVGQRPRVNARFTNSNCTQMMQSCDRDQTIAGIASCANGGILPLTRASVHDFIPHAKKGEQVLQRPIQHEHLTYGNDDNPLFRYHQDGKKRVKQVSADDQTVWTCNTVSNTPKEATDMHKTGRDELLNFDNCQESSKSRYKQRFKGVVADLKGAPQQLWNKSEGDLDGELYQYTWSSRMTDNHHNNIESEGIFEYGKNISYHSPHWIRKSILDGDLYASLVSTFEDCQSVQRLFAIQVRIIELSFAYCRFIHLSFIDQIFEDSQLVQNVFAIQVRIIDVDKSTTPLLQTPAAIDIDQHVQTNDKLVFQSPRKGMTRPPSLCSIQEAIGSQVASSFLKESFILFWSPFTESELCAYCCEQRPKIMDNLETSTPILVNSLRNTFQHIVKFTQIDKAREYTTIDALTSWYIQVLLIMMEDIEEYKIQILNPMTIPWNAPFYFVEPISESTCAQGKLRYFPLEPRIKPQTL